MTRAVRRNVLRAVAVLLLGLGLHSCALDRLHARRAAATAAAAQDHAVECRTDNACAIESPYQDLAARGRAESTAQAPVHYVNLLDRGEDALLLRVHLIRSAHSSISLQTYIFSQDDAGYLILDELIKAARRGVKVRLLSDQLFSLDDTHLLAALARAHVNFEMRMYNPTFHKARTQPLEFAAGILCCFFKFNQRMHNKLLLIDDSIGIAGGRNNEDRYYDWDDDLDYRDRDILVAGPAAAEMAASFNQFWNHPRSVRLSRLRDVAGNILDDGLDSAPYAMHKFKNPQRVAQLSRRADDAQFIRSHFVERAFKVAQVEYFSDAPDKPEKPDLVGDHELSAHIIQLVRSAKTQIVLQTPYLVLTRKARNVFEKLRKEHPDLRVIVSTNSLAATDAFYVYALSYKYKKRLLKLGFEIHEFRPFPQELQDLVEGYANLRRADGKVSTRYSKYGTAPLLHEGVRFGLHAKSMVIDDTIAVIGSHNFDPRSTDYNTESGVIVHDRVFASAVRDSILRDADDSNSWTIARRPHSGLLSRINNAIGDISTALPLFDLWPFRYATSYQLNEGCQPLAPTDPHFLDCYTDVGDFPEVSLPLKTIYTRMVTAFGAGLTSIM